MAPAKLEHGRHCRHPVRTHKMIPVDRHGNIESGTTAGMPVASKHLAKATQLYVMNR